MAQVPSDVFLYGSTQILFSIPGGHTLTVESNGIRDNSNGFFHPVDGTIDYVIDSFGNNLAIGSSDTSVGQNFYIVLKPDRMYFVKESSLVTIADNIRVKTGNTDPMTLSDMAYEISTIQVGGGYDFSKMYNVTLEIPSYTTATFKTSSSSGLFVEHTETTSRRKSDYVPSPTNMIVTNLAVDERFVIGMVSYIGALDGMSVYAVLRDGTIPFMSGGSGGSGK